MCVQSSFNWRCIDAFYKSVGKDPISVQAGTLHLHDPSQFHLREVTSEHLRKTLIARDLYSDSSFLSLPFLASLAPSISSCSLPRWGGMNAAQMQN